MKICVVRVNGKTFNNLNLDSLVAEFYCLGYGDNLSYDKGDYHIVGKKTILFFCDRIEEILVDIENTFTDEQSIRDISEDREVLKKFRKVKAS